MPTLSSGISIASGAVQAQSRALEVIEHNIANASTPGYRRQKLLLSAAVSSPVNGGDSALGAGERGDGVIAARIDRFNLEYFDTRYRSVLSDSKNWDARSQILSQLEPMLAETTDDGLIPKLDQFWASWQSVSTDPTNISLRQALLDDASSLAGAFNRRTTQITQLRSDQNLAITGHVEKINGLAEQIAQLNAEISRVLSVGEQPNDLMDKRDLALDQLAELTGAVSTAQQNGEVLVSIAGHALVVGHDAFQLHTATSASDSSVIDVFWSDNQKLVPPAGSLKGTLDIRDKVLGAQLSGLNTLATAVISQVNGAHRLGFGLNNVTGQNFFAGTDASDIAVNNQLDAASIATSSNLGEPGNNSVALQIAGLKMVKGMVSNTVTMNEFYNAQVTDLAMTTQDAADQASQHQVLAKALGDQRNSASGVSLDEEAADMAKVQKAYQAAARVLTAYDDLLDTVINHMGLVGL